MQFVSPPASRNRRARLLSGAMIAKQDLRQYLLALIIALACAGQFAHSQVGASHASAATAPSAEVAALADDLWAHYQRYNYLRLLSQGLQVLDIADRSLARAKREAAFAAEMLERAKAIDRTSLEHNDWLTLRVITQRLGQQIEALQYYWLHFDAVPYNVYSLVNEATTVTRLYPLTSEADRDNYLNYLGKYADVISQLRSKLEAQRDMGILVPKPAIDDVVILFSSYVESLEDDFDVAPERLSMLDEETRQAFHHARRELLRDRIAPALMGVATFFDAAYRAAAPSKVGLRQYPEGRQYYEFLVRRYLGPDMTPAEVHEIGLSEVGDAQRRMADIRDELGYDKSQLEFHQMLRTDERFSGISVEHMARHFMDYVERLEPHLLNYFSRLPRAEYGVRRLDPALEATLTAGYYQRPRPDNPVGLYRFNGANPAEQSLIRTAPLLYHELIPGHHMQIGLLTENPDIPEIRKMYNADMAAYQEGWAEYAANYVAKEAGMYEDVYDRYALAIDESFVGVRLVVDTGLNYFDLSLSDAREYFFERSIHTRSQVASDTLRYAVAWPAHALAYRMGFRKHRELRLRAERVLGKNFDVRAYHDAVLDYGPLPLNIFAQHIEWWLEREQQRLKNDPLDTE